MTAVVNQSTSNGNIVVETDLPCLCSLNGQKMKMQADVRRIKISSPQNQRFRNNVFV
jgi:hypothetical protein